MSTEALTAPNTPSPVSSPASGLQPSPGPSTAPTSAIAEPWQKDFINSDYTLNHKALDRFPEHLSGIKEVVGRHKTLEDLMGTFANSQMLNGKKGLAPLPANSPANVLAERKALLDQINGVPPKASDYQIARPEFVPESQWNPKLVESTSAWAHKYSVSPAALKELTDNNMNLVKDQIEGQKQYEKQFYAGQQKTFDDTIRQENIPSERANSLAERGAERLGVDLTKPENVLLMKNATFKLAMMRHAVATGEDSTVQGNSNGGTGGDPVALANDIVQNPANPLHAQYWNRDGKFTQDQRNSVVAKVTEYHRMALARKK